MAWRALVCGSLAVAFGCGGKAIVDPPVGVGGAGGDSTNAPASVGPNSTVVVQSSSSGCECVSDVECTVFQDGCSSARCDGCFCAQEVFPPGTPCEGGVCSGGLCVECIGPQECPAGGACDDNVCVLTVEQYCDPTCDLLAMCGAGDPGQCQQECFDSLQQCEPDDFAVMFECNELLFDCDINEWSGCITSTECF